MTGTHRKLGASRRRSYHGKHRGGATRARGLRLALAPWIVMSIIAGVLVSGMSVGYALIVRSGCHGGSEQLVVAASSDQATVVDQLAQKFGETQSKVGGHCIAVTVEHRESADVVNALGSTTWDSRNYGQRPDVWMPDSSTWIRLAAQNTTASQVLPTQAPSVASSPTVLAMPAPMASALHASTEQLGWQSLGDKFSSDASWGQFGHPEWGDFRIGMTDPRANTVGLLTALSLANGDHDDHVTDDELSGGTGHEGDKTVYRADVDGFLNRLPAASAQDPDGAGLHESPVFTASERDVVLYNNTQPAVELTAVYPAESPSVADYPYATLRAPWVTEGKKEAAGKFLDYVRGTAGRLAYGSSGFRGSDFSTRDSVLLRSDPGIKTHPVGLHAPTESSEAISHTMEHWRSERGSVADQQIEADNNE